MIQTQSKNLQNALEAGRLLSKNSRAQNAVYPGLLAAAGAYLQQAPVWKVLLCYVLIVLLYAVATSWNNFSDIRTDSINRRKDNPLVDGILDRSMILPFVGACLMGIGLVQVFLGQPQTVVIAFVYLLLSYAYSDMVLNMKARGLWGTAVLAACYGALPLLIGVSQGSFTDGIAMLSVAVLAALLVAPLVLAKDYKDYEGDRLTGKNTPLVRYGVRALHGLAYGLVAASLILYIILACTYGASISLGVAVGWGIYAVTIRKAHCAGGQLGRVRKAVLTTVMLLIPLSLVA